MSIILKTNKQLIKNFTIFAERHCGTKFLEKWIKNSFDIPLIWKYGWKHFWTHNNKIIPDSHNTLFIGMVRNPYNWIPAMYKKPYHIILEPKITLLNFINCKIISIGEKGHLLEREYTDIFSLREIKNQHLLNTMPCICENYLLLNYESLFNINIIFDEIASNFKLPKYEFYSNNLVQSRYILSALELDHINKNLNWQTENFIGYTNHQNIKESI
jgi:hypothetical protein